MRTSFATRTFVCAAFCAASLSAQVIRTNAGFHQNQVERNDDGSSDITPLGFTINFFGKLRDSAYVNNNGNLTFDSPLPTYTPFGLQKTSREIIAPFFADVDTRGTKSLLVTYGQDTVNGHKAFAANYVDVGYFKSHDDKLNRFQVVVIDRSDTGAGNFTIEFNYERIVWETGDASGGVNGYGGVPATVGWSNGTTDAGTSFELPGSMISGAFLDSGPRALVRTHLNTAQVGRILFQARDGIISPGLTIQAGPILPDGTVSQNYSFGYTAIGVDTAVTWDLVPDLTMPPGLRFSNGQIVGVPTATGTYGFTVSATANIEGESVTVYQRGTITIGVPKLSIRTVCPVPAATVGQLYSTLFSTLGASTALWSVDDRNTLPPGLNLSSNGQLTGAPSTAGTYSFLLRASSADNSGTLPAEKTCTLTVNPSTVRLTNGCSMPDGTVGVPYAQTLISDGGIGPYRYTLLGQLPQGLSLSSDGRLVGLPLYADNGSFSVQVTDSRAHTIQQDCTVKVGNPGIRITTGCPLPRATTGTTYSARLIAADGQGPYTWSVSGGSLPPGLSIASGTALSGTPMAAGPYTFRLVATDSTGQQTGLACSLPVLYGPLGVAGCPLPEATVGDTYRVPLRPAGGSEPFYWTVSGNLPPGLQLSASGAIEGQVTAAGDYQFSLGLSDRTLLSVSQPCSLKVKALALRFADNGPTSAAALGQRYSTQFAAAGGTPPYRFQFFGYLPDGLTGASDGSVTGTPTKVGTTSFGVRVTDARGATSDLASSIDVGLPGLPAVQLSNLPAKVEPARVDIRVGVDLSKAYTLPVTGQLVLTLAADTQNLSANANQPDPHVRFGNGQLVSSFQIPAGSKHVDVPLLSTGTVATTMTVSVRNLQAGGVPITVPVTPQIFQLPAVSPVLTSACFTKTDWGTQITVLGSSTTRELATGEVSAKGLTPRVTDLSGVSADYFSSDGTIRFGGAFTLQFDADSALNDAATPFTVRLANRAGWSTTVTAQKCQ